MPKLQVYLNFAGNTESYHHADPNFGPDPKGDRALMAQENPLDPDTWVWTSADELFLELIRKVHEPGMRIIFDGVSPFSTRWSRDLYRPAPARRSLTADNRSCSVRRACKLPRRTTHLPSDGFLGRRVQREQESQQRNEGKQAGHCENGPGRAVSCGVRSIGPAPSRALPLRFARHAAALVPGTSPTSDGTRRGLEDGLDLPIVTCKDLPDSST